jgi:flavin-binding protein dodecin
LNLQRELHQGCGNAVLEVAKTVPGMKWARVEMELDSKKIAQYRTTTKIYFDIKQ